VRGPVLDQGLHSGKTRDNRLLLYLLTRMIIERYKNIILIDIHIILSFPINNI